MRIWEVVRDKPRASARKGDEEGQRAEFVFDRDPLRSIQSKENGQRRSVPAPENMNSDFAQVNINLNLRNSNQNTVEKSMSMSRSNENISQEGGGDGSTNLIQSKENEEINRRSSEKPELSKAANPIVGIQVTRSSVPSLPNQRQTLLKGTVQNRIDRQSSPQNDPNMPPQLSPRRDALRKLRKYGIYSRAGSPGKDLANLLPYSKRKSATSQSHGKRKVSPLRAAKLR